jgi:cytochrome P450
MPPLSRNANSACPLLLLQFPYAEAVMSNALQLSPPVFVPASLVATALCMLLQCLLLQFPYAEAVVREALRLYPPATMISREVKEGGFPLTPEVRGDTCGMRSDCGVRGCGSSLSGLCY